MKVLYRLFLFFHFTYIAYISIVCIVMKIFFFIFLLFLASCRAQSDIERRLSIVDIMDRNFSHVGRWVRLDSAHVLTVAHVYEECSPSCFINGTISLSWVSNPQRDTALLMTSRYPVDSLTYAEPQLGEAVVVLWSGGLSTTGTILSLSGNYIGYDGSLSGRLILWAIETDIVLSPGESGSPVWTVRGELIWVMSAVDIAGKRGWVVRP